ncbi:hypothetical protein PV326_000771 [Microctonus aethiopoides]|nr:hypothetical protein PV326_000771 [Microctonus aethiopoides]
MNSNQTERSVKRKSMEKGVTWNLESDIIRRVPCDDLGRTRTVKSPWLVGAREIMHGASNTSPVPVTSKQQLTVLLRTSTKPFHRLHRTALLRAQNPIALLSAPNSSFTPNSSFQSSKQ